MSAPYQALLKRMPLFEGITTYGKGLLLQRGEVKEHSAGEQLCREGDLADSVLLILTGKLQAYIERDGIQMIVRDFAPGAIVGNVAVLCGLPRAPPNLRRRSTGLRMRIALCC
jgi:CRP-like cAMP-binding protein